jgi:putative phosphoesterase
MILGMISDTHGLLREQALVALRGSDLIIHAGDVGDLAILDKLRAIAPVVAIRGNIDQGSALPETALASAGSFTIYVIHDLKRLDLDPALAGIQIVISGHSHKPCATTRAGVLYINPGSAGPRRFRLPITVARLDLDRVPWEVHFIQLEMHEMKNSPP